MAWVLRSQSQLIGKIFLQNTSTKCACITRNASNFGFIGLGNMGGPMAKNILKKGHKVSVFDVSPVAIQTLKDAGAQPCTSPGHVAQQSDCVITMLPNNAIVLDAYEGKEGILRSVKPGTVLIDSSTVDPSVPKVLLEAASKRGAIFVDAPVSGGVNAAAAGTLTFMIGGSTEHFPAAQKLLSSMGTNVVHCGSVGAGQIAKICNNMLLAISMVGTSEAMNLGIRMGLDPKVLMSIINSSSGRCWTSEVYSPVPGTMDNVPCANNYQGGFGTRLMAKDLGLAQNAATDSLTPIPLGSLAHQIYRTMIAHGFGEKDFSFVYQFLKQA